MPGDGGNGIGGGNGAGGGRAAGGGGAVITTGGPEGG